MIKVPRSRSPFESDEGDHPTPRRRDTAPRGIGSVKRYGALPGDAAPTKPAKIRPTKLRIIGGQMRGRGVLYLGDRSTRPMKDSIRETLFNILGQTIKGSIALDLFAGTGVLAIESLSRGSVTAIALEKSGLTAKTIRNSADSIGIGTELDVLTGDTFRLAPVKLRSLRAAGVMAVADAKTAHWIVYFCPPYAMWLETPEKLFELLQTTAELAPPGSQIVVETDKFFDPATLPMEGWDIRNKGNVTLSFLEVS